MLALFILLIELAFIVFFIWYYKRIWFYRDPYRKPPNKKNIILAPADGDIIYIRKIKNNNVISKKKNEKIKISEITKTENFSKNEGWIIGIYMKPTDVHFNYAPMSGRIKKIVYTQSKINLPMIDLWEYINLVILRRVVDLWSKKFHLINERNTIFLENEKIRIIMVEIADKFVNKIDCFVKEKEKIKLGQKISFIRRGSQVDLIIYKKDLIFKVKVGEQVYGSETILASYQ